MSIWIIVAAVPFLLAGLITIAACIASSRFNQSREVVIEDMPAAEAELSFAPAQSK